MEINNYKTKFKLLFDKLLQNKVEINGYYAENIIKFLEKNNDKEISKLLESSFFTDLMLYALNNFEKASQSVKIFFINLLTLVISNELQFSKILHMKGFYLMAEKNSISQQDVSSQAFRLACIKQATAQIQHSSGLYWNIEQNIWQQIYNSCYENQPSYILNASYNFLKTFIWKLNELDDERNLVMALETILKPILESDYKDIQYLTSEIEQTLIARIKPALMTVLAIMDTADVNKIGKTIHLMEKYFILEAHFYTFNEATRDPQFALLTSELHFLSTFATATVKGLRNQNQENEFSIEGIAYFNILYTLIQKRMIPVIIDFAVKSVIFWFKLGKISAPTTFQRYGRTFMIEVQLVIILLVPLMNWADTVSCPVEGSRQDGFTNYVQKLIEISSEQVIKGCYLFKDLIEENDKRQAVILALRNITRLKGHLSNNQAGTIFQALFYVLKRYVPTDECGALVLTESSVNTVEDAQILSLVLDTINMILKEHNINWYDSCEVICLYNYVVNLLKQKRLPSKLVMQALDLINITVKKFLSPDLNLLMESKTGSALNEIGETIRIHMSSQDWEVRDSALQLLFTCTEMAFIKYIPFQKLILTNGLIRECAVVACCDPEMYAQASALKSLAAAARLQTLWSDMLSTRPNIYIDLTYLVKRHPEGIVRKEAVAVLTEIFSNQTVTAEYKKLMYCIMQTAALDDLHWEVQLAAINFWRKAIQTNLANRGMIDGKFPSVTFSRERRKIITLNHDEIQKQLSSILTDLAQIGCLSALKQCMNSDFNLKVMEHAYNVANELIEILNKYNFKKVPDVNMSNIKIQEDWKEDCCSPMDLSYCDVGSQDEVIESIINTNLADLMDELLETKQETTKDNILNSIKPYSVIDPNEFLNDFRSCDFYNVIEERKKWNSGMKDLNYLLNELLSLDGNTADITIECS